jgi:hypothetical protein
MHAQVGRAIKPNEQEVGMPKTSSSGAPSALAGERVAMDLCNPGCQHVV